MADATTQSLSGRGPATEALREKEADKLLEQLRENEHQSEQLRNEAENLTGILNTGDAALLRSYSDRAKRFLGLSTAQKCRRVFDLLQSMTLGEQGLRVELGHPNGHYSAKPRFWCATASLSLAFFY